MEEHNIEKEEQMINEAFQHLLDSYLASKHRKKVEIITKAFNFAKQAHKGVRRLSGEPYIMHPIAVAQIVCTEIGLGSTSICAALLHDVVEDTDFNKEDLQNIFGDKIADIVDGLTKISGGIFGEKASQQAESFKKLLLTMSDDIRVILIKIADRLHNMRTLGSQPANKQYKIAGETLYIYAPLANRLGLNKIKEELEDLWFRYELPEKYNDIAQKLASTREERNILFEDFTAPIRAKLDSMGMDYIIKARVKTPYSIWNKMQTKHVTFDEIYDILAVRIIFKPQDPKEEINDCFRIYAATTSIYKPHPDRFRDWLNHPKANGYQALQVTLMSHKGRWIEVQIRSERMDEFAEQGFAAHWKYKEHMEGVSLQDRTDNELDKWLCTIKEILDDPQPDAMDFLDTIKLNLFASEIFVFTPKGEIKTMPADCTALDFAFSIHTFLGSHCIGAKVNHKLVPLSHKLQSGDQVEILTSKAQHVQKEWVRFVTTAKAKTKIEALLRRQQREQIKQGEELLANFFEQNDIDYNSLNTERLKSKYNCKTKEDLCLAIVTKQLPLSVKDLEEEAPKKTVAVTKSWRKFIPFLNTKSQEGNTTPVPTPKVVEPSKIDKKVPVSVNDNNVTDYIFADCCHPIPGDDALGYIDDNKHIVIHKRQCPVATRLESSFGNRILDVKWGEFTHHTFAVKLHIEGIDNVGVLNKITNILSMTMNINIRKLNVDTVDGIFDCTTILNVLNVADVTDICRRLQEIDEIEKVTRYD